MKKTIIIITMMVLLMTSISLADTFTTNLGWVGTLTNSTNSTAIAGTTVNLTIYNVSNDKVGSQEVLTDAAGFFSFNILASSNFRPRYNDNYTANFTAKGTKFNSYPFRTIGIISGEDIQDNSLDYAELIGITLNEWNTLIDGDDNTHNTSAQMIAAVGPHTNLSDANVIATVGPHTNVSDANIIAVTGPHSNRTDTDIFSIINNSAASVSCNNINFSGTIGSASICDGTDAAGAGGNVNGTDISPRHVDATGNITADGFNAGVLGFTLTESNDDLKLMSNVVGSNYFSIETTGTFLEIYANPGPSNDDIMFSFAETQGADTEINFYEGGTGNNRFWSSGSVRIGGSANSLCSEITGDVDCDTAGTGADLVLQDDFWLGGKIFVSTTTGWSNVTIIESQISDLVHTTDTYNSSAEIIAVVGPHTNTTNTFNSSTDMIKAVNQSDIIVHCDNINFSGTIGSASICDGDDSAGGGGAGDKWSDGGAYIFPNSTFADNIQVFGYVRANDWTNVTVTESQVTDLGAYILNSTSVNFEIIKANDWSNVTITESQVTDLTPHSNRTDADIIATIGPHTNTTDTYNTSAEMIAATGPHTNISDAEIIAAVGPHTNTTDTYNTSAEMIAAVGPHTNVSDADIVAATGPHTNVSDADIVAAAGPHTNLTEAVVAGYVYDADNTASGWKVVDSGTINISSGGGSMTSNSTCSYIFRSGTTEFAICD